MGGGPEGERGDGPIGRDPVDVAERVLERAALVGVELRVAERARQRRDLEEVRPEAAVERDRAEGQRVEAEGAGLVGLHRGRPADGREVGGEAVAGGVGLGVGGVGALEQADELGRPEAEGRGGARASSGAASPGG